MTSQHVRVAGAGSGPTKRLYDIARGWDWQVGNPGQTVVLRPPESVPWCIGGSRNTVLVH